MTKYRVNSLEFARAWLAVSIAACDDKARPTLYRSVSVDIFETGFRLCSTDSYVLLHAWVPFAEDEFETAPVIDAHPKSTYIAADVSKRAAGLMKHIIAEYAKKSGETEDAPDLTIRTEDKPKRELGVFEGFDLPTVTFRLPDREEVILDTREGPFVSWPDLLTGAVVKVTDSLGLNPEILARFGKLGKLYPEEPLKCRLTGSNGMILLDLGDVSGCFMPIRVSEVFGDDPHETQEDDEEAA